MKHWMFDDQQIGQKGTIWLMLEGCHYAERIHSEFVVLKIF